MFIIRLIISILAIAMIVVGTILMISPVPLGIILILLGLIVLALANPAARPLLRWIRKRWPWFNRRMSDAQEHSPAAISEPLKQTEPKED